MKYKGRVFSETPVAIFRTKFGNYLDSVVIGSIFDRQIITTCNEVGWKSSDSFVRSLDGPDRR